jgi:hypothetical protein
MAYCSKCGEELTGARKFCSYCGFPVPLDLEEGGSREFEGAALEVDPLSERGGTDESRQDQEPREQGDADIPPAAILVNKECSDCGEKCDTKCFFCNIYVCDRHSDQMQILADKSKFGDVVVACGNCSDMKRNKEPTEAEAKEMGFFFKVKPYHQWTILERK